MTYIAKPKLHHPTLPQQGRLHPARLRRQGLHAVRRLRPRLDLGGHHPGLLGAGHRAAPRRQAVGHRLQSKTPDYFLGAATASTPCTAACPGADRRQPGQPRPAVPGRLRRRRLRLDRPGPVRPRHAPRRAHGLHRREQRRLRPDQGPVLGHRRPGSKSKKGVVNNDSPVDLVALALQLGATYVARSFSGDKAQLVPLIKGAIGAWRCGLHRRDQPLRAFNNHAGSTKSYDYVREHNEAVSRIDFIDPRAGDHRRLRRRRGDRGAQHDGTVLRLRKLHADYDPTDCSTSTARPVTCMNNWGPSRHH
jgi:2-oxoglutarate ferredoxin oxidoreductase subunit beta